MTKSLKIISLALSIIMLFGILVMPAAADDNNSCGDNLSWEFLDGTLTVSGEGDMEDYYGNSPFDLPPWFQLNIKNIVVEDGVTSVGVNAFQIKNSADVESISLPASLTEISKGALNGYIGILSISKENTTFKLTGNCLMKDNTQIILGCDDSIIPNDGSVKTIAANAFSGCKGITSIDIPEGITGIGDNAFKNCSSLEEVTLPDSLTFLGASAFEGCIKLTSINIPNGLKRILSYTFSSCDSLKDMIIPARVKEMYFDSFNHSLKLKVYNYSAALSFAKCYGYDYEIIGTIGDADEDGSITVADALIALRIAAKLSDVSDDLLNRLDMNYDDKIDVDDALSVLRIAAGLI